MRSSGPALFGAVVIFVGGFFALRSTSVVLAAEARLPRVRELAAAHGVAVASALALLCADVELDDGAFALRLSRFAALVGELGEPLAACAVLGDEERVRGWVAEAGGKEAALAARRAEAAAFAAVAFEQWRARFSVRESGRP